MAAKKNKKYKRETFAYLEQNCYKKPEKKEILIMLLLLIPHLLSFNQQQLKPLQFENSFN